MIYKNNYLDKLYQIREDKSLKDMIINSSVQYRDKVAFLTKEIKGGPYKHITYGGFREDVDALGTMLMDMGLEGEKIAIIGENSYQWVVSYFAIVNGTGIAVPLDKELSKQEIYNLIKTAGCKAVFFSSAYEKYFKDFDIPYKFQTELYSGNNGKKLCEGAIAWSELINSGKKLMMYGNRKFTDFQIDPLELRVLLFTSGTTGKAKAVMLCHNNLISNIKSTSSIVKVNPDDRTLSVLPIHHTFESTLDIMTMLYNGGSIAFYEGLKYVSKNIAEAKCTILIGVPLIFEGMYGKIWKQAEKSRKVKALKTAIRLNKTLKNIGIDARHKLFKTVYDAFGGRLRLLVCGAAAINPSVVRGFKDLEIETVLGYGLTETSPLVTGTPDFVDRYKKAGSCGPVIPGGELQIINKNEEGIGEVIYKGPNVMLGYYNMPQETEEVLKEGWFHTGDLGFVDENGWLYLTGRKKNVIVTKTGKNIYPEELETELNDMKYIEECMVYGMNSDESNETIVAVQVIPNYEEVGSELGENYTEENLYLLLKKHIADFNQSLPNYKRIRNIKIRTTEFIKTTTKKIKRQDNI